jgi:hypothetical protein
VIERVIAADDADEQGLVFFGMESGKLLKPPFRLKLTNRLPDIVELTPELKQWIAANHVDLLFHLGERGFSRMNLEMTEGFAGQLNEWATVTPARVLDVLAKVDSLNTVPCYVPASNGVQDYHSSFGSFVAFRTRDKVMGVYQLTGVQTDTRRGVWIRYKLVEFCRSGTPVPDKSRSPKDVRHGST